MRKLLVALTGVVLLGLTVPPPAPMVRAAAADCGNIGARREFRDLSSDEWNAFIGAVKVLMQRPSGSQPSRYDRFANDHRTVAAQTHGNAMFLVFNRRNLREFEIELQKIDPTVTLPYWDWGMDAQAPELSPIFGDDYLGGNGDRNKQNAVVDGPFKDFRPQYPQSHALQRDFSEDDRLSAFYSQEALSQIIVSSTTYDALRRGLEIAPNGTVHNNIGGDMATQYAPNDPIFWLHRAYIDKLWDDWQKLKPAQANTVNGTLSDRRTHITLTTRMPLYQTPVQDVISTQALCYSYESQAGAPQAPGQLR